MEGFVKVHLLMTQDDRTTGNELGHKPDLVYTRDTSSLLDVKINLINGVMA